MIFSWHLLCRQLRDVFYPIKWAWQRVYRGYDDTAWWDLHLYLAKIAAPVLKEMADRTPGYPPDLSSDEWTAHLSKMHIAMDLIANDSCEYSDEQHRAMDEGCELMGKWYRHLWT